MGKLSLVPDKSLLRRMAVALTKQNSAHGILIDRDPERSAGAFIQIDVQDFHTLL